MASKYEVQKRDGEWQEVWTLFPGRNPRSFVVETDTGNDIYLVDSGPDTTTVIKTVVVELSSPGPTEEREPTVRLHKENPLYDIGPVSRRDPFQKHRVRHV